VSDAEFAVPRHFVTPPHFGPLDSPARILAMLLMFLVLAWISP